MIMLGLFGIQSNAFANDLPATTATTDQYSDLLIQTNLQRAINDIDQQQNIRQSTQNLQEGKLNDLAQAIPNTIVIDDTWSKEQIYNHLERHPEAFEWLLLKAISRSDVHTLKTLLPAYAHYPKKDASIIDWGNALIALSNRDAKTAVKLFRKINAVLPDVRLLRLQMASALYQNKQTQAAKNELEKLLREDISDKDRAEIKSYIQAINQLHKWNYSLNLSFLQDKNLENAPPIGTTLGNSTSSLTYNTPHESGTGLAYHMGANKQWAYTSNIFTSATVGVNGSYYWDNQKFNDLHLFLNVGLGYKNDKGQIQIEPLYSRSWYGGGSLGDNQSGIKPYTSSVGLRFSGSRWINNRLTYQHTSQFNKLSYEKTYQNNDAKIYTMSNGLIYAPSAKKYYSAYWNLSKKEGTKPSNSYQGSGVSLGWHNTWDQGWATLASIGIASKKYDGVDFSNIQKHNYEYSAGLSLWKRDWSIMGLTPRLNISSSKTTSNSPFDESSETKATIVFTKTF